MLLFFLTIPSPWRRWRKRFQEKLPYKFWRHSMKTTSSLCFSSPMEQNPWYPVSNIKTNSILSRMSLSRLDMSEISSFYYLTLQKPVSSDCFAYFNFVGCKESTINHFLRFFFLSFSHSSHHLIYFSWLTFSPISPFLNKIQSFVNNHFWLTMIFETNLQVNIHFPYYSWSINDFHGESIVL